MFCMPYARSQFLLNLPSPDLHLPPDYKYQPSTLSRSPSPPPTNQQPQPAAARQLLDLDKDLAEGFYPITERSRRGLPRPADSKAAWEARVAPFRVCLPPLGEPRSAVLRDLMVIVALRCGYDARTR